MTKIIIADDHPLFRGALRGALESLAEELQMHECEDYDNLRAHLSEYGAPNLILLDLNMPGVSGLSGLINLRAEYPSCPTMVVSASDDPITVRRVIELGAAGFLSKSASTDEIRSGVRAVLNGEFWASSNDYLYAEEDAETASVMEDLASLTPQQSRVLAMIADGLLNKQIAYELSVSEATIKAHVSAVLQKLKVDSRTQAVIKLSKIGFDVVQPNYDT